MSKYAQDLTGKISSGDLCLIEQLSIHHSGRGYIKHNRIAVFIGKTNDHYDEFHYVVITMYGREVVHVNDIAIINNKVSGV